VVKVRRCMSVEQRVDELEELGNCDECNYAASSLCKELLQNINDVFWEKSSRSRGLERVDGSS
jgi:hypothetical protein